MEAGLATPSMKPTFEFSSSPAVGKYNTQRSAVPSGKEDSRSYAGKKEPERRRDREKPLGEIIKAGRERLC